MIKEPSSNMMGSEALDSIVALNLEDAWKR